MEIKVINTVKKSLILNDIIEGIKKANGETTISMISGNEALMNVFHDVMNKHDDIDFELLDDEQALIDFFNYDDFERIRAAERGDF